MKLLVAIPALNEETTIADVIRAIPSSIPEITSREILVVDDGSTDRTQEAAKAAGADIVSHGKNIGVGFAFRTALKEALRRQADILVQIDADGQFDPHDIPLLLAPIVGNEADIAMCTRFSDRKKYPHMPGLKIWGNHMVRRIINASTGESFTDVSNGFRAYNREAMLRLTLFGRFTYTHEVIFDAVLKGLRIKEVPLNVRGERAVGTSRVARNLLRYALQWLAIFFRALRDASPFQVFGTLSALVAGGGALVGGFVFAHWWQTGQTFPYRSLIIVSAVLILLSAFLMTVALLADMLRRQRILIEELLYHARKSAYDRNGGTK